jgi:hypothetical protein
MVGLLYMYAVKQQKEGAIDRLCRLCAPRAMQTPFSRVKAVMHYLLKNTLKAVQANKQTERQAPTED